MKINLKQRFLYLLAVLLLIGLIALYVLEFSYFNRTLNFKVLAITSLVLGAALGAFIGWTFARELKDIVERFQIMVFFTVLIALFMPLFASLANRLLPIHGPSQISVEFLGEEAFISDRGGIIGDQELKPSGYYLFFKYRDKVRRIENDEPWFEDKLKGDLVQVPVRKGAFGFTVVRKEPLDEQ